MSANISQARRYREMVRFEFQRCPPPPDSNPDKAFRIHLETLYEKDKSILLQLADENASDSEIPFPNSYPSQFIYCRILEFILKIIFKFIFESY